MELKVNAAGAVVDLFHLDSRCHVLLFTLECDRHYDVG